MTVIASKIDLRKFSSEEIFNQGNEGSCVANAVCEAIRIQSREYHRDVGELAREQIYYDARTDKTVDTGTTAVKLLNAAMVTGIASQDVALPYMGEDAPGSTMYQKPSQAVYSDAATQKVLGYTDLSGYLVFKGGVFANGIEFDVPTLQKQVHDAIGTQLMQGKAVLMGFDVPKWFYNDIGYGKPLAQQTNQQDHTLISGSPGHEVIIVGMDDNLNGGSYIVQNSWGGAWGDNGYASVPYKFLGDGYTHTGFMPKVFDINSLVVVDGFQGVDVKWTPERSSVAMVYASVLDRAVEHEALDFWATPLKNGASLQQITNSIMASNEATQKYGGLSTTAFVKEMYLNTLGRAADTSGLGFWSGKIDTGVMTRGDVAYNLMTAVLNTNGTAGAPTAAEHDFLVNRTTVAENYGLTYQIDGTHLSVAQHALDNVTSNADSVQVALVGIQQAMGWA